jgi:hypothetical protein
MAEGNIDPGLRPGVQLTSIEQLQRSPRSHRWRRTKRGAAHDKRENGLKQSEI